MERVAAEWARQGETLDPADMPVTRLLNSALDGVAGRMDETRAEIAAYAGSDLLCYRADEPETLAERQRKAFDPVLDWAAETLGARFVLAAGVMHVRSRQRRSQPFALRSRRSTIRWRLRLGVVTNLTGSAILALAVARRRLTARGGLRLAHIDEDYEIERWGEDAEARRAGPPAGARWRRRRRASGDARRPLIRLVNPRANGARGRMRAERGVPGGKRCFT